MSWSGNLVGRRLPILVLSTNDLRRILASEHAIVAAVVSMRPGQFVELEIP